MRRRACQAPGENSAVARSVIGRGRRRVRIASVSSQPGIIIGHVQKERRDVNQTVDSVEDAAVAGDERAHVLGADVTLDHADGKIAELASNANDETGKN